MVDSTVLVHWLGNKSRIFSKLLVGDVVELTFPGDSTVWKAVVNENEVDDGETREPRRLVRTPDPWRRERPGESVADGRRISGRPTLPPLRY